MRRVTLPGPGLRAASPGLVLLVTAGLALSARADTVVLKNGKKYTGKIKSADAKFVVIRSEGIDWTLKAETVASQATDDAGVADAKDLHPPPPPVAEPATPAKGKRHGKGKNVGAQKGDLVLWFDNGNDQDTNFVRNMWNKRFYKWQEKDLKKEPQLRQTLCLKLQGQPFSCHMDSLMLMEYEGKFYDRNSPVYTGHLPE
jgi:hypothetical protein